MKRDEWLDWLRRDIRRVLAENDEVEEFFMWNSFGAIPESDVEAWEIIREETAPVQGEVRLHLEGGTVKEHSVPARKLTKLIDSFIKATDSIAQVVESKSRAKQARDKVENRAGRGDFLITAINQGSVEIVISAPPLAPVKEADGKTVADMDELDIEAVSSKSQALSEITKVLAGGDLSPDFVSARKDLMEAVELIDKEEWECTVSTRRRSQAVQNAVLDRTTIPAVLRALEKTAEPVKHETWRVQIDGFRGDTHLVYVKRDDGRKENVRVPEKDAELFLQAKRLAAAPEQPFIQITIDVHDKKKNGDDRFVLTGVEGQPWHAEPFNVGQHI